jgi:inhibitor of KinA
MQPACRQVTEDSVLVEFEPKISPEVNRQVHRLTRALERNLVGGLREVVPAYRSLLVYFDPQRLSADDVTGLVRASDSAATTEDDAPQIFRFPTVYGGGYGPDLDALCRQSGRSPGEVIELFSAQSYRVYFLGYLCCLAYLGGVPAPLHIPRLATPRTRVPRGSVGCANEQALVLPLDQPSGWHYLGRTFVTVYDPAAFPPSPIRPGDRIEFPAVSENLARAAEDRPAIDFKTDAPAGS